MVRASGCHTHTAQGCGGNPNMVYIYDLATDRVGAWGPAGGGMWGRTGPAIDSKGVMYTGTGDGPWNPENGIYGNGIIGVRQNPQTKAAELVDYYGPSKAKSKASRNALRSLLASSLTRPIIFLRLSLSYLL
jgi:hypothetical protein